MRKRLRKGWGQVKWRKIALHENACADFLPSVKEEKEKGKGNRPRDEGKAEARREGNGKHNIANGVVRSTSTAKDGRGRGGASLEDWGRKKEDATPSSQCKRNVAEV